MSEPTYTAASGDGAIRRKAWSKGYNYLISRQQRKTGVILYLCNPDAMDLVCGWQVRLTPISPIGMFLLHEVSEHTELCSRYHNNPKHGELPKDSKDKMEEIRVRSPHFTPSQVNAELKKSGLDFVLIKVTEVWNNMKRTVVPRPTSSDPNPTAQTDLMEASSSSTRAEAATAHAAPEVEADAIPSPRPKGSATPKASARASGGKGKKKRAAVTDSDEVAALMEEVEATPAPPKIRKSGRGSIPSSKRSGM